MNKAIALAAIFTFVFAFFGSNFAGGGDYFFHFEKAKNGCENLNAGCETYAPLFHWLAAPFSFHVNAFFYFVVFLLAFVTPMILYHLKKSWVTVWFYYSLTSYYWFFIDGIFAQALAMILLLLVLVFKDWKHQAFMVLLAILTHGSGFLLVLIAFILKNLLNEKNVTQFLGELKEKDWVKIIPCSGVFGLQKPVILTTKIDGLVTTGQKFTVADAVIPFTKIFPFPLTFFAVKQALKDKQFHIVALLAVALIGGFWVSHRIFYMIPIILIPSLVAWFQNLKPNHRTLFLVITLVSFGFQLYSWVNFKLVCSTGGI